MGPFEEGLALLQARLHPDGGVAALMEEEAPVVKLTYAILLAALKKRAERIRIDGNTSHCVVTFRIDGVDRVEMMLPALLRASIVRRIAVMASLPDFSRAAARRARSSSHSTTGSSSPRFTVQVSGHGGRLTSTLDILEGFDH